MMDRIFGVLEDDVKSNNPAEKDTQRTIECEGSSEVIRASKIDCLCYLVRAFRVKYSGIKKSKRINLYSAYVGNITDTYLNDHDVECNRLQS